MSTQTKARLATVEELRKTLVPAYLDPVPTKRTLKEWFKRANISFLKANPAARNGGGVVWYSVAEVERMLREMSGMPGFGDVNAMKAGISTVDEAANRELVGALELCNEAFGKHCPDEGSRYGQAWAAVKAALAKHKGAA